MEITKDIQRRALPTKSADYVKHIEANISNKAPHEVAKLVKSLVDESEMWRETKCLNMMASENTISRNARRLLDSDLATRITEGSPGAKDYPTPLINRYIDEIEGILITQVRRLFGARYVEWRPISNTMANASVLFNCTRPGDLILVQAMSGGGNMSYHLAAIPQLRSLQVEEIPPTPEMGLDIEGLRKTLGGRKPACFVIGGSNVLFPYPVGELRELADDVGARILYDAAHVALLIAYGCFQHPLSEGADVITLGTHKIMGGPIGGLVVTNDHTLAEPILKSTFPAFMQTRDLNKYAAAAYALTEMVAFGESYVHQMVTNARSLAEALSDVGFTVIGKRRGYTATHQVFLDCTDIGAAGAEARCQASNILIEKSEMLGDRERGYRTGVRISVQEVTRRGMKEPEMHLIARFIARAVSSEEERSTLAAEVENLLSGFREIDYSFDGHA